MSDLEKLLEIKKYIDKHYNRDFNFKLEHSKNKSCNDSYYYGVDTGQQYVYDDILKILEK